MPPNSSSQSAVKIRLRAGFTVVKTGFSISPPEVLLVEQYGCFTAALLVLMSLKISYTLDWC